MTQQSDGEQEGQPVGLNHERAPYHRPLFGSLGAWMVRLFVLALAVGGGFVLGVNNPDAEGLLTQAEHDIKKEKTKIDNDIGRHHTTDANDQPIQPGCLNPPHSKPIVGFGGIHSEGAAGFDLTDHMKAIPYRSVRQHGADFVYLRATRGSSSSEPHFLEAWDNLAKCGVERGVIHDFRPTHAVDKQIENVLKHTNGQFGEMPPVVDVQRAHGTKRHRCEVALPKLMQFIEALEQASKRTVVIRTNGEFWNQHYDCEASRDSTVDTVVTDRPLWVIDPGKTTPDLPAQWAEWSLWQRTLKGRLGRDDKVAVDNFNGSDAQLRDWVLDSKKG